MSHRLTSPPEVLQAVGKRLDQAMRKRDFDVRMLAQSTGRSTGTIYHFLRGTRDMHLDDLREIGSALQVEPSWIAWGEGKGPRP